MKQTKLFLPKINTLVKKNLEFLFLIFIAISVVVLVQIFNFAKEQKKNHFYDVLNNIYFEKTLNNLINDLDPKYQNIEHKVLQGESFSSILEKYEISKNEINKIKNLLSKKENLNKLKQNQVIKFTLDLEDKKKIINIIYPISKKKKNSIY